MENGAFEGVFPIENGDIPASYVSLPEGNPGGHDCILAKGPLPLGSSENYRLKRVGAWDRT